MNILILSCGTRNKLVRFFKESGTTKIVGTDCSIYAPALYDMDNYYIVPRMTEPQYLDIILDICKKEEIHAVLPLQEDELYLIAAHKDIFIDNGIIPIVSNAETIQLCRDKYAFYQHLIRHGLPTLPTYADFSEFKKCYNEGSVDFPVFIKPNGGCGSIGTQKVENMELLSSLCKYSSEKMIIQQFSEGEEFGADIYVDMISKKTTAIFLKKKLRMRAGETEKAISFKNDEVFDLILKTVKTMSLTGPIDMDLFEMNGHYYISEINPRFGGGYPHAYCCGVDFPKSILRNISGKENIEDIGNYSDGVCMLKYTDLVTIQV